MSDVAGAMGGGAGADAEDVGAGGDQGADEAQEGSQVICTIAINSDGTFKLYHGDEPEEGGDEAAASSQEAGSGGAGADVGQAGAGGASEAGGEGQEAGAEDTEGEDFDDVAGLMKAVLEIVKDAQDNHGGENSFDQGYAEAGGPGAAGQQ